MTEQTADSFEVSPQQEQLWLAQPDGPSDRIQAVFHLHRALDPAAVEAALNRSVARHEILRTTFVRRPGIRVPLQAVAGELTPAWSTADLSSQTPDEQASRLEQLAAAELAQPFDFVQGPLLRAQLVRLDSERYALVLTASALCADASSLSLLAGELTGGQVVEDPLQYADFAAWQRELQAAQDDEAGRAREFWAGLEELSGPAIPFSHPERSSGTTARVAVRLGERPAAGLAELSARYGVRAATVAHAAWHVVLARSAGSEQVSLSYIGSERRHADLEGAVGAFSRPVPVSTQIDSRVSFAELLPQLEHDADEAMVWQDYVPAHAPELPVGFVCAPGASLHSLVLAGSSLRLWLTCIAGEHELSLSVDYDPEFLARPSAERLARRLEQIIASAAADPGRLALELELLDDGERGLVLFDFNRSGPEALTPPAHERFAAHAAAAPAREAVVDEHGAISYGELDARANQLANRLRRAGVGPDVAVGLCSDRSIDMVVGLLGILKAGGAYVPLHYEHPPARLGHQLQTAGARAIVTQEPLLTHLPEFAGEVICLDRDRAQLDGEDRTAPRASEVAPENLAYVIYTSGSTGTPKGVGVTHGNLANYAAAIVSRLEAEREPLAFGVATSISTDLGNTSVFGALCSGGTLVLVSPVAAADAGALHRQLERSPIDVLKITPSHIGALISGGDARVLPRRWLIVGGERAPWDLVRSVRALSEDVRILNHYGPTEGTIGACTHEAGEGPGEYEPASVPIGSPLAGYRCYVLDERRAPVPIGAPGRLYIGGAGVAREYIQAPEQTAERFVEDPFAGARMYDTGDVARWLPDGALEFLGRTDEQVKIRGYRVEPLEVESALRAHAGVSEAAVVARPGSAGDLRLIAYCAPQALDQGELKDHLAQWLPEFMLPAAIVTMSSLPRTPSGKVDRLALPDPEESGMDAAYLAPRSPIENTVAEIWQHVLGVERIGVHDDFFALGGHSLLATQVVAQVRTDFAVELPLHSLFTYPTVESLSEEIVRMMGDSDEDETARLIAELEGLSDEEAERLLAGEAQPPEA
jgi:amino acid adenylation domain-containing protein